MKKINFKEVSKPIETKNKKPRETKRKEHNFVKSKSWFNPKGLKTKYTEMMSPELTMLIRMELRTGNHEEFIIKASHDYFIYNAAKYIIDNNCRYYVASSKMYAMDYHQDFSLPFKRHIDIEHVRKLIAAGNLTEVEEATNPILLEKFQTSSVMEKMMKAQEMDEYFKQQRLVSLVTVVSTLLTLALLVYSTGMLENLKMPF